MNSLFQGYNSGDSKDLINFILTQLHKELNVINNNNINKNKLDIPYYQYDRNQVLNIFFEEFKRDNNSIISDLFFGINENISECLVCKKRNKAQGLKSKYKYNFQYINYILFPLEKIRNYRNNKFMQMNANIMTPNMMTDILSNNRVFIMDCFEYYQNPIVMKEDNQIYCHMCKKKCDANYRTKIYYPPNILILIMYRGKNMKYNVGIDFLPSIDITQFIDKDYAKGIKAEYDLYAVLTYIGENSKNGHYIAFCKCHDDTKKWVCYNDDNVTEIVDFISQVHNYGIPSVLFYERINA
jgi:ubiquitin C-terminal hydrolase